MHADQFNVRNTGDLVKTAPEFAPYPAAQSPKYSRWMAGGVAVLVLLSAGSVALRSFIEPRIAVIGMAFALLLWLLALLLRVLYFRLSQHNAQCYAEAAEQVRQAWWQSHRQKAALVESVLVSAVASTPEHGLRLFGPDHLPPEPQTIPEGRAIRLGHVFGSDVAERERNLAILLALQWHEQRVEHSVVQPLRCYWLGSLEAWQAFVEQMARCFAPLQLPEQPEPWQGIRSLDSIIDQLQGAPATARILCAGCQSLPYRQDSRLPAGEAAVLWLFGPEGGVRFSRGEWFSADTENLPAVAKRVLQQSELAAPAELCVSFSQPDLADLPVIGWNTRQHVQDANFGHLESLQAMVVQTLAAWYAEQHRVPCAWLANDPYHTLALGIVEPDDSNS
ncbi:hypothetical protein [Pseudomonas nunensis]|uniref:Type VI secretion system protein ImpL n=1 Tax=Pseudomonas nunensis TaxID=2961896 RepID=A0ABY5EQU6_9PSED|nr:hypothetical protein [Pseudomonas nunensis]MCL5228281.1 hypothetical protein [Pseudomonas nunensis]UTO17190.1 hypothetical protein NK667_12820 [Pseudomonas nunensis]